MKNALSLVTAVVVVAVLSLSGSFYVVAETEQVIITMFGKPVGETVAAPGLHFKIPIVQKANFFDKRFLEWDGDANQIPTRDKKFIWVDTYARWRIIAPLLFFQRLRDESGAQSRLDDILDGETRDAVARHDLVELVRSTNRDFLRSDDWVEGEEAEIFYDIKVGRDKITREILANASKRTLELGIELVDLRLKRINYVEEVRKKVYERMVSERRRIAEKYRSEGQGEGVGVRGEGVRELKGVTSVGLCEAQGIVWKADAEATRIYAEAYNQDPDLYRFMKTLETYQETMNEKIWMILSTDGEFFEYLKGVGE